MYGIPHTPRVHVEHRRDGHIHVRAVETALLRGRPQGRQGRQRVQHQLPVAEVHALGISRGAGRVEGRGPRVLVEVGELVLGGARSYQFLVLGRDLERSLGPLIPVDKKHDPLRGLDPVLDLLEHR
jgi:hypothetical protein